MGSIRTKATVVVLITIAFYVAVAFNACSEVDFAPVPGSNSQSSLSQPGLVINDGAAFTAEVGVQLTLIPAENSREMFLANDPQCQQGQWEPYRRSRNWVLGGLNGETKVFVKYREEVDGVETDCYSDAIVHDNEAPLVVYQNVQDAVSRIRNIDVRFVASDAVSGLKKVECARVRGGPYEACVDAISLKLLGEGLQQVFVRAQDKAGNATSDVPYSWTVDYTPPTVLITRSPAKLTGDPNAAFEFVGFDVITAVESFECKLDNQPNWEPCTTPFSRPVADGKHTFAVRSRDRAGNVSLPAEHAWDVDATAPTVRILAGPQPLTRELFANFTFEGFDNGVAITEFECRVGGGPYAACASPHRVDGLTEGPHQFLVRGRDTVGNFSAPASYAWVIDATPPTIQLVERPDAITRETGATFRWATSDGSGSGVERVECKIDAGNYAPCDNPRAYMSLAEGPHEFAARAVDRAGNTSAPVTHRWMIDITAPTVTIAKGPEKYTKETTALFEFTAADGGSGVERTECRVDGADYAACTSPHSVRDLTEGRRVFYARAVDKAGNVSPAALYDWEVDLTPPRITFVIPPRDVVVGEKLQIVFNVEDLGSGVKEYSCAANQAQVNCVAGQPVEFTPNQEGTYTFSVSAADMVGNMASEARLWTATSNVDLKTKDFRVNPNRPVDILFIVDNSGSMNFERSNLAMRINGFLDKIAGLDWQIGIISTDARTNTSANRDGKFVELINAGARGRYILNPSYGANAQRILGDTVQGFTGGSGEEQAIHSAYRAMQRALDARNEAVNAPNRAFFRNGAQLAVVLISDEDETPQTGHMNDPRAFLAYVNQAFAGQKNISWNSIITIPGDKVCLDGEGQRYGFVFKEIAELTGAGKVGGPIIGTVCAQDYASQLANLGDSVRDMQKTVTLECEPVDRNNDGIKDVTVEYRPVGQTAYMPYNGAFAVEGFKLIFGDYLPVGDFRFMHYCRRN